MLRQMTAVPAPLMCDLAPAYTCLVQASACHRWGIYTRPAITVISSSSPEQVSLCISRQPVSKCCLLRGLACIRRLLSTQSSKHCCFAMQSLVDLYTTRCIVSAVHKQPNGYSSGRLSDICPKGCRFARLTTDIEIGQLQASSHAFMQGQMVRCRPVFGSVMVSL